MLLRDEGVSLWWPDTNVRCPASASWLWSWEMLGGDWVSGMTLQCVHVYRDMECHGDSHSALSLSSVTLCPLLHLSTTNWLPLWWHEIIFIVGRNELTDRSTACHLGCVAGVVGRVIGGGGWEESWCCWLRWKVRTANQSAAQLGPSARLNQSEPSSARPDQLEDHVQCTLFEESN